MSSATTAILDERLENTGKSEDGLEENDERKLDQQGDVARFLMGSPWCVDVKEAAIYDMVRK